MGTTMSDQSRALTAPEPRLEQAIERLGKVLARV